MTQKKLLIITIPFLFASCQALEKSVSPAEKTEAHSWNIEKLNSKASEHLDSTKIDVLLFKQDIETYDKYQDVFQSYPLNKSPFPVAVYDYAVSYFPFSIEKDGKIIKGVKIGECEDPDCEKITYKLTLLVLTNDLEAEELTMVDSRNFPYLTAQGVFKVSNNEYDWVFSSSPDGFSTLLVNMKLFDLRFGETVVIYPQVDKSFLYEQIKDSPNKYKNFDEFKEALMNNPKVKNQLTSEQNIR